MGRGGIFAVEKIFPGHNWGEISERYGGMIDADMQGWVEVARKGKQEMGTQNGRGQDVIGKIWNANQPSVNVVEPITIIQTSNENHFNPKPKWEPTFFIFRASWNCPWKAIEDRFSKALHRCATLKPPNEEENPTGDDSEESDIEIETEEPQLMEENELEDEGVLETQLPVIPLVMQERLRARIEVEYRP
ncbi:hypothetical protein Sjap_026279 [Stephania japonica]|uniref:Uncharacterized protein n=1 Tax=Stephania japonica TaxID=461633 RepID=A0AAP0EB41_9MAGN